MDINIFLMMESKSMKNYFEKIGKSEKEVKERIEKDFNEIFFGPDRIYHEETRDGVDYGYMVDTGNNDVRSEGQSYGMMISVMLNRRDIFDRIWNWTKRYMLVETGDNPWYFGWSANIDGTLNSTCPAPDGEEFFSMSLIFAHNLWREQNYLNDANKILHAMIHNKEPMFNPDNKLIKFVPSMEISDPSYHLSHFYELYAKYGNKENSSFYLEAAKASREYWKKCCHPATGLSAEYANYDGTPNNLSNHHLFYSDAYRTGANISLDYAWTGGSVWHKEQANNILNFFKDPQKINTVYRIDGTEAQQDEQVVEANGGVAGVLHPLGLASALATSAIVVDNPAGKYYVQRLWDAQPRTGARRYYDNLLYMFAMLALGGYYRVIE